MMKNAYFYIDDVIWILSKTKKRAFFSRNTVTHSVSITLNLKTAQTAIYRSFVNILVLTINVGKFIIKIKIIKKESLV